MKIKKLSLFFFTVLVFALFSLSLYAEGEDDNKSKKLNKPTGTPIRTYLDINNIFTVIKNDGISDIDVDEANSGLIYPKGSGKGCVYISGLLWGALIEGDPQVRVGGSAYRSGLQGGKVLGDGFSEAELIPANAEDDALDHVRV